MSVNVSFSLSDNRDLIRQAAKEQIITALEAVGIQAEGDVKDKITEMGAVDTGRLRTSIAHKVVSDEKAVYVGTNVEYAVYVHEGTGAGNVSGGTTKARWVYQDPLTGDFHMAFPQKPRRFLKEAIQQWKDDYISIFEEHLKR